MIKPKKKRKKEELVLVQILKSRFGQIVFILSLILIYFLTPKRIFYSYYLILGILFVILTSLLITCFAKGIKDKVKSARKNGKSIFGVIAVALGLTALQTCTVGAPICGATIGAGIVALIFPGLAFNFLEKYSILILSLTLIIQVIILQAIGGFRKINRI